MPHLVLAPPLRKTGGVLVTVGAVGVGFVVFCVVVVEALGVRGGPLFQAGRLGLLPGTVNRDEVGSLVGLLDAVLVLR